MTTTPLVVGKLEGVVVAHALVSFSRLQPGLALTVLGWLRKILWGDDDTATAGACAYRIAIAVLRAYRIALAATVSALHQAG